MAQAGDAASRRGVVPAPYRALMADNDAPGQPVPGSWQETLQSFSTEAGENTDADRGLKLAFWAMIICLVGAPVALVGLFYSARGRAVWEAGKPPWQASSPTWWLSRCPSSS
jgi:hypothetical protein